MDILEGALKWKPGIVESAIKLDVALSSPEVLCFIVRKIGK